MENNKQNDSSFKAAVFEKEANDFRGTLIFFGELGNVLKENQARSISSNEQMLNSGQKAQA